MDLPGFVHKMIQCTSISKHLQFSLVYFQRKSMHYHYLLQQVLPTSWVLIMEQ